MLWQRNHLTLTRWYSLYIIIWYHLIINFPDSYHRSIDWYPISGSWPFSTGPMVFPGSVPVLLWRRCHWRSCVPSAGAPRAADKKIVWSRCCRGWWTNEKKTAGKAFNWSGRNDSVKFSSLEFKWFSEAFKLKRFREVCQEPTTGHNLPVRDGQDRKFKQTSPKPISLQ